MRKISRERLTTLPIDGEGKHFYLGVNMISLRARVAKVFCRHSRESEKSGRLEKTKPIYARS